MSATKDSLTQPDIDRRLSDIPTWTQRGQELVRTFSFSSYLDGLDFVNRLGQAADRMDHHPSIVLDYKKVTVTYSTHSAGGLTDLDFKAAAMVDEVLGKGPSR